MLANKSSKSLPKTPAMTLHAQWVRCGKITCRCALGQLHGPYTYLFWREGGRQQKRYVRLPDVDNVRTAISAQQHARQEQRALRATSGDLWRNLRDQLKEVEE